ncbi:MAG: hypothetical protein J6K04_02670 [Lachnospiraceae bacterium]|nr:hypothetical protein [Lachnospiraceae bacterium]
MGIIHYGNDTVGQENGLVPKTTALTTTNGLTTIQLPPSNVMQLIATNIGNVNAGNNALTITGENVYSDYPLTYLQTALENQGLETTPSRLKEVWFEGDYKYTVRVRAGNAQYTEAESIYRVSRQSTKLNENGQGTGLEYLGTDGNWYHKSVLTEFFKDGTPNPNYNESAAKMTHIPVNGD